MSKQTVRTTITFPIDLHENIRKQALKEKKSMNDVVVTMLRLAKQQPKITQQIKQSRIFLTSFAAKYAKGYIPEDIVRSERDGHI